MIIEYTNYEIRKNLALLEIHLKQFQVKLYDCDCLEKHIMILEGLSEEGLTMCDDCGTEKFESLLKFLNLIKDKDYQKDGIKLAIEARKLRKKFVSCSEDNPGMKDRDDVKEKIKELKEEMKLSKDERTNDRLSSCIYLCEWFLKGRGCHG